MKDLEGEHSLNNYQYLSQIYAYYQHERHNHGSFEHKMCAALGLPGEAGEVADYLKKVHFHEHTLNEEKLKEEMGDTLFYLAMLCEAYGFTLREVAEANLRKLEARYPDGFSFEASRERKQ